MDPATSALTQAEVSDLTFKALTAVGATLAAVGAAIGFFLKLYWDNRARKAEARDRERLKQREILYESLRWFEGRTQKRSIGIAVVNASWSLFPEFQSLWIEVFANQAVYLLTGSKQGEKEHEHENLRRILDVLDREYFRISPETKNILNKIINKKLELEITTGLTLTTALKQRLESSPLRQYRHG
jgi:hypothetical protein